MGLMDFLLRGRRAPTVPAFIHAAPQRYGKSHPARDVIAIALDGAAPFGSHAG